jgi:hypothetical protein
VVNLYRHIWHQVVTNIPEEYSMSICRDAVTFYREVLSGKERVTRIHGDGLKTKNKAIPLIGRGGP